MLDIFWNIVTIVGGLGLSFAFAYGVLICAGERDFLLDRKADGFQPRRTTVEKGRVTIPPGGAYDTGLRIIFNTGDAPMYVNIKGQDYETHT